MKQPRNIRSETACSDWLRSLVILILRKSYILSIIIYIVLPIARKSYGHSAGNHSLSSVPRGLRRGQGDLAGRGVAFGRAFFQRWSFGSRRTLAHALSLPEAAVAPALRTTMKLQYRSTLVQTTTDMRRGVASSPHSPPGLVRAKMPNPFRNSLTAQHLLIPPIFPPPNWSHSPRLDYDSCPLAVSRSGAWGSWRLPTRGNRQEAPRFTLDSQRVLYERHIRPIPWRPTCYCYRFWRGLVSARGGKTAGADQCSKQAFPVSNSA